MKSKKISFLLIVLFFIISCSTPGKSKRRGRRKNSPKGYIEKSYNYKRTSPLGKKYPDYQPFRANRNTNEILNTPTNRYRREKIKKFVVIPNFVDKTERFYESLNHRAPQLFAEQFKEAKRIVIEKPEQIYAFIGNKVPGNSREDDLSIAKSIAQNANITSLITGAIYDVDISSSGNQIGLFKETRYYCHISLEIRAIDINLQKIIFEERITGNSDKSVSHLFSIENKKDYKLAAIDEALKNAYEKIIWQIIPNVEKIGWKGKIAKVDRNRIYINGGLKTGLSSGDILLVSEAGELVYNPDTGRPIGRAPGNIKGTLRVVDFFGKDGAITVINSGAGFKENDLVELQ